MSGGDLRVFGLSVPRHARRIRAGIGVVPQHDNIDPDFTVYENLRVYGSYFGLSGTPLHARIQELLEFVELRERAQDRTETLSGGMKRRLAFARAMVNDPQLLILDEPTTGLDPQARHMLWTRVRALARQGKTLLLTTHYMEEAERLCDELLIMDRGVILDRGSPRELARRHVEPEVLEIHGRLPDLPKVAAGDRECRVEIVGDSVYCYAESIRPLIKRLERYPQLTFLHRPANLEDVFLKLTGRDLRD